MTALDSLTIRSTSAQSAECDDIPLRQTETTQLVFRPEVVDNEANPTAAVRGSFVFQRKSKLDKWEDKKDLDLSKLRADEWIKLELHSQEVRTLFERLEHLYQLHEKYGIPLGEKRLVLTDAHAAALVAMLNDPKLLRQLLKKGTPEVIAECIKGLSEVDNLPVMVDKLKNLNIASLEQLNALVGLTALKNVYSIWKANADNASEDFWQSVLTGNPWVLSQLFASPIVFFGDKMYLGGKRLDNKGGKVVDFIYQNKLTENLVLVEIKTPSTPLINSTPYRGGAYAIHPDLGGAISQVLHYKDMFLKNYYGLRNEYSDQNFVACNPRCVLITGTVGDLHGERRDSFELVRRGFKDLEIVAFDELFGRVDLLIDLLTGGNQESVSAP